MLTTNSLSKGAVTVTGATSVEATDAARIFGTANLDSSSTTTNDGGVSTGKV